MRSDGGLSKAGSKTVATWVGSFRTNGVDGLHDRSLSSPIQIGLAGAGAVERLRRQRHTQEHLAAELGILKASVSRILKRRGVSRLCSLEPLAPRPRYQREVKRQAGNTSMSPSMTIPG